MEIGLRIAGYDPFGRMFADVSLSRAGLETGLVRVFDDEEILANLT